MEAGTRVGDWEPEVPAEGEMTAAGVVAGVREFCLATRSAQQATTPKRPRPTRRNLIRITTLMKKAPKGARKQAAPMEKAAHA